MRLLLVLFFVFAYIFSFGDTIYVSSRTDARLLLYRDSLTAYEVGSSVCTELSKLFQKLTNSHDYDSYFLDPLVKDFKPGEAVDTLLGYSEVLPTTDYPDTLSGNQFNSTSELGQRIAYQFKRLDTLNVKPYATVVGAEMPVLYLYRKPTRVVIYQKLDRCWEKKRVYTTLDRVTHFIVDSKGMTKIPYNILRYYENDRLVKIEWTDPITQSVIKTFKTVLVR